MLNPLSDESRGPESGRPWLSHYPKSVQPQLNYPREPIWRLLEESAYAHPKRMACCFYNQKMTYAELLDAARRAASMLIRIGLQPGERVGVLLPNIPEYLVAVYGIWIAHGVVVSLSPLMEPEETANLIQTTKCRVVIGLDLLLADPGIQREHMFSVSLKDRLPRWERFGYGIARLKRIGLRFTSEGENTRSFANAMEFADHTFRAVRSAEDAPAYVFHTGGTTGHRKAVMLTHRNLVANAWQMRHWMGNRFGQESILAVLPFCQSYGLATCVTTGVAMAASLVLHHRFDPHSAVHLIERHQTTIFPAVPEMLVSLNKHLAHAKADLSSLKFCLSGTAPLDPAVARKFAEHSGAAVVECYGLSEASTVTHAGPLDGTAQPGTIGLPLPDTEAQIVDTESGQQILPPGEVGELIIRGHQVMASYWNNPDATGQTVRDGWLYTGDLAACDENGFFRIIDRKKDLIVTAGFKVYPADVEYVLRRIPGVADAAVIGVSDPRQGQIIKAVIAPEENFDRATFDHSLKLHLPKHKQPQIVEVLKHDLPRNSLGKVLRHKLRELHSDAVAEPSLVAEECVL